MFLDVLVENNAPIIPSRVTLIGLKLRGCRALRGQTVALRAALTPFQQVENICKDSE